MGRGIPASSRISWLLVMVLAIMVLSCQGAGVRKNTDEREALKKRVTEYWGYKIKREFDRAYQMELPLYRKTVSMVRYIKRFRSTLRWKEIEIEGIDLKGDRADVRLKVRQKALVPGIPAREGIEFTNAVKERWIKEDGVWYHVPRKFLKRATISGT